MKRSKPKTLALVKPLLRGCMHYLVAVRLPRGMLCASCTEVFKAMKLRADRVFKALQAERAERASQLAFPFFYSSEVKGK